RAQSAVALALEAAHAVVGAPIGPDLRKLVTAWLPSGLRRYCTSRLLSDPTTLLVPAEPPVARIRWELAAGRRMALIGETLSPGLSGFSRPTGLGAVKRALDLARRWGGPTLRSFRTRAEG
ncbi:MAG TPA: hypothetical protein VJS20_12220, partial [Gemmatimonadales bacterium]|nr:hypothetical protein [Gemmatimonadales bacterium]